MLRRGCGTACGTRDSDGFFSGKKFQHKKLIINELLPKQINSFGHPKHLQESKMCLSAGGKRSENRSVRRDFDFRLAERVGSRL